MADRVGQQLGNYRLMRLIGQGGFGEVYLGEHVYLKTQAAIKVLQVRLANEDMEGFLNEARTIASLKHPHIVRVLDFGIDAGTPFLVMDYAPYGTLRQRYPRGTRLPPAGIVYYVKQVAAALQYAHDKKLIHRDVKPENILLDENNQALLSDFGIAFITQSSRYQSTQEVVGTVAYMAPEQLQGKPRPASDQYALAVVVYEWLCGDRPFHGTFVELYSQHSFVAPPSLREKDPAISPEVELVVLRALAKDPQQRFESVQAFAIALEEAYTPTRLQSTPTSDQFGRLAAPVTPILGLSNLSSDLTKPVSTTPLAPKVTTVPKLTQPAKRGISRRMALMGLAGIAAIGLAGSGLAWLAQSQKQRSPLSPLSSASQTAQTSTQIPTQTAQVPTPQPTKVHTSQPTRTTTAQPTQPPLAQPTQPPPALGATLYTYHGQSYNIRVLAWSPDGRRIGSGSDDTTAQVWDAATGNNAVIYRGHSSYVEGITWSPDSKRIASASADTTVQIWNPTTGDSIYTYRGHGRWVNRISWSPNGKYIASGDQASSGQVVEVRVWEANTGNTLVVYRGHTTGVFSVAWSPDGTWIASCGYDGTLQVWEATTGNHIATYNSGLTLFGLSWSPDSKRIVVGGNATTAWILDASTGNVIYTYDVHSDQAPDVAWSPDGRRIGAGSNSGTVDIFTATNGNHLYTYTGQSGHIDGVVWSPDSKRVASGSNNGTVQVWQAV